MRAQRLFCFAAQLLYQWDDDLAQHFLVETVLAIEAGGVGIVLMEEVIGVHNGVMNAKEAVAVLAVPVGDVLPLLALHLVVMLDDVTRDAKRLLPVLASVEELMLTRAQGAAHGGHVQGWIDADAHEAAHLLGIHASHAGADDDVGLLIGTELLQIGQGIHRVNGDVGRYHLILGQEVAQVFHRAAGPGGTKAVKIDDFHEGRIGLLALPGLGAVENTEDATDLQLLTVEPDGAFVGLAALGVIDLTALILVTFLGEAAEEVDADELAIPELGIGVVGVLGVGTFLQPHNLAEDLTVVLVDLHIAVAGFCNPRTENIL